MRLGIHGWRLNAERTGVARYLRSIIRAWTAGSSRVFTDITLYTPQPLDPDDQGAISPDIRRRVLSSRTRMLVWENLALGPAATDDVLFCPSFSRPLITRSRTVVATHDMVYRVQPELFSAASRAFYRTLYEWSDRHAALVITDAEAVKEEIIRYCRIASDRIRVTYLAPAECFRPVDDAPALSAVRRRHVGGEVPYFLFVGKTTGRRSLPTVLEGFAQLKRTTVLPHRLVLVGRGTDSPALRDQAGRLGVADAVVHTGFLDDREVNLLYNAATALVTGALYETSSLPVMEAQATGLPVICYRNPGMVEITGGAALFLDAVHAGSLCDAMIAMAEDDARRAQLRAAGLESAARFSWERCARETMSVLEDAARA
ncbi:MAG TPA: glycosyltransferase family 1 protein [Vicinamibacterales bacterium]|nr:glycosyltransferase family 1 protein [Vicinamibacterales bacterium]